MPGRLSFASYFGGSSGRPLVTVLGQVLCKQQARCQPSAAGSDIWPLSQAAVLYVLYWRRIVFLSLAAVSLVGVIRAKVVRGPVAALMGESQCVYRRSNASVWCS